jgi:glycosyltransferase involved in cell wall biosynthesis
MGSASSKKLLIVVSTWQPAMIADMQRARMMCRHLRECGWESEVLTPDLSFQPAQCTEADAHRFFDPATPVHEVSAKGIRLWDAVGSTSISWRGLWPVLTEGNRLLACGSYDLVYFSTAHYMLSLAGVIWKKRFGVPFVLDLHDPWYARAVPRPELARGLRGKVWSALTSMSERVSLASASGVTSVSPVYLEAIDRHYGHEKFAWQREGLRRVEPFGYEPADVVAAAQGMRLVEPAGQTQTIAYCGAGGRVMRASWNALCRALAEIKASKAELLEGVRFVFKGTSLHYRLGDSLEMIDRAREQGIEEFVTEEPERLSYVESIRLIANADAALLLGVDDRGYMASKLFSYLAHGKPLLAVIRHGSIMLPYLSSMPGVTVLEFDERGDFAAGAGKRLEEFLTQTRARKMFDRAKQLEDHSAKVMAQRLSLFFEQIALG